MPRYTDVDDLSKNLKEMEENLVIDFPLLQRETLIERERGIGMARQYVLNIQPTADVAPVLHGRWIDNHNGTTSCSICATWINTERLPYARHCLYCGALMDLGKNNER